MQWSARHVVQCQPCVASEPTQAACSRGLIESNCRTVSVDYSGPVVARHGAPRVAGDLPPAIALDVDRAKVRIPWMIFRITVLVSMNLAVSGRSVWILPTVRLVNPHPSYTPAPSQSLVAVVAGECLYFSHLSTRCRLTPCAYSRKGEAAGYGPEGPFILQLRPL